MENINEINNIYLNKVCESCAEVFGVGKENVMPLDDEEDKGSSFSVVITDEEKLGTVYFIIFTLLKDKSHFEIMLMRGSDFNISNIFIEEEVPNALYHQRIIIGTDVIKSGFTDDVLVIGYGKFGADKYEIANLSITEGVDITVYIKTQYHCVIENAIRYLVEKDGTII